MTVGFSELLNKRQDHLNEEVCKNFQNHNTEVVLDHILETCVSSSGIHLNLCNKPKHKSACFLLQNRKI